MTGKEQKKPQKQSKGWNVSPNNTSPKKDVVPSAPLLTDAPTPTGQKQPKSIKTTPTPTKKPKKNIPFETDDTEHLTTHANPPVQPVAPEEVVDHDTCPFDISPQNNTQESSITDRKRKKIATVDQGIDMIKWVELQKNHFVDMATQANKKLIDPQTVESIKSKIAMFGQEDDEELDKFNTVEAIQKQLEILDKEEAEKALANTKKKAANTKKRQADNDHNLSLLMKALDYLYAQCYYIGIQLIRYFHDVKRVLFQGSLWLKYNVPPYFHRKKTIWSRKLDQFVDTYSFPFRDIGTKSRTLKKQIINRFDKKYKDEKKENLILLFCRYLYSLTKPLNHIANYIAPVFGFAVLAAVILYFQDINYVLELEYAGKTLGYVESENDFYEAKNQMYDRLINEDYIPLEDEMPSFRLTIADQNAVLDVETLTDKIMGLSKNEVVSADGIYIDDIFLGAVEEGDEFLFYIAGILDSYTPEDEDEENMIVKKSFVKKVTVQEGVYPHSSMTTVHEVQQSLENNDSVAENYIVKEGDTLESIALDTEKTTDELIKNNSFLKNRANATGEETPSVLVGEEVQIDKIKLSLGVQVTRRETYTEEIDFEVEYQDNPELPEGNTPFISGGEVGKDKIIADVTYIDGKKVSETRISIERVKEPVTEQRMRGTLQPAHELPPGSNTSKSYLWPVDGGYVSAGLYGYYGHTGTDIAAPTGTAVRASRSGTVIMSSNTAIWPWGRRLIIDHGDGTTTMYAHCSSVLTMTGQYVEQGQLIAKVGSTGNSSGSHLHFQLEKYNQILNPEHYIGSYYPGR